MENIVNLSVLIFDFQCQCIRWLLFVRFVSCPLSSLPNTHTSGMVFFLSLTEHIREANFFLFIATFHFGDNIKSHNKYCYLAVAIFFLFVFRSRLRLNYLGFAFPFHSNSICIFASSIQHHFCCYIYWSGIVQWKGSKCHSIWFCLCRVSVLFFFFVGTRFNINDEAAVRVLFHNTSHSLWWNTNNKINNNDLSTTLFFLSGKS